MDAGTSIQDGPAKVPTSSCTRKPTFILHILSPLNMHIYLKVRL